MSRYTFIYIFVDLTMIRIFISYDMYLTAKTRMLGAEHHNYFGMV